MRGGVPVLSLVSLVGALPAPDRLIADSRGPLRDLIAITPAALVAR